VGVVVVGKGKRIGRVTEGFRRQGEFRKSRYLQLRNKLLL
jgi:hypothetical protein